MHRFGFDGWFDGGELVSMYGPTVRWSSFSSHEWEGLGCALTCTRVTRDDYRSACLCMMPKTRVLCTVPLQRIQSAGEAIAAAISPVLCRTVHATQTFRRKMVRSLPPSPSTTSTTPHRPSPPSRPSSHHNPHPNHRPRPPHQPPHSRTCPTTPLHPRRSADSPRR